MTDDKFDANDTSSGVASKCDTCGACGIVFSVFTRQRHHLPWVLYDQTQLNHMELGNLQRGVQLQLVAVANCGTVSVIITPFNPPIPQTARLSQDNARGSGLRGGNTNSRDYIVHRQRYNTLAQHYANKTRQRQQSQSTAANNHAQTSLNLSEVSVATVTSTNPSRVVDNGWTLQYNASVNLTDLVYLHIWWKPRNSSNDSSSSNSISAPDNNEYLISWEDASGVLKGHSITRNHYSSFVLWPHTQYKIQVKIVSGDLSQPRNSNILIFDASKAYQGLSADMKNEEQTMPSDSTNEDSKTLLDNKSIYGGAQVTDAPSYAKQLKNNYELHAKVDNLTIDSNNASENNKQNPSNHRSNTDSYVYANVDKDYSPLYVETVVYQPIKKPVTKTSVDVTPTQEGKVADKSRGSSTEQIRPDQGQGQYYSRDTSLVADLDVPQSKVSSTVHQYSEVNKQIDSVVESGISSEALAGIIGAFVCVLLIIIGLVFYMRYYVKSVSNKKGSFRADGYDTASSVSSKGTEKSDDGSAATKKDNSQWLAIRHPEFKPEANYGVGGKYHETRCLDPNASSRTNSIEFSLHSSDSLLPTTKYTSLSTNNTSNLSGATLSTNLAHNDPNASNIYGNGSDCSGNSSNVGSYHSNVRYTNGPGTSNIMRSQCLPPVHSANFRLHDDYSEIIQHNNDTDPSIYTVPSLPQQQSTPLQPATNSSGMIHHSVRGSQHSNARSLMVHPSFDVHPTATTATYQYSMPPQPHNHQQQLQYQQQQHQQQQHNFYNQHGVLPASSSHFYNERLATDGPPSLGSYPTHTHVDLQHTRSHSQCSQNNINPDTVMLDSQQQLPHSHSRSHSHNSVLYEQPQYNSQISQVQQQPQVQHPHQHPLPVINRPPAPLMTPNNTGMYSITSSTTPLNKASYSSSSSCHTESPSYSANLTTTNTPASKPALPLHKPPPPPSHHQAYPPTHPTHNMVGPYMGRQPAPLPQPAPRES